MDWNHLRTFEAVVRRGSLTQAARELGVSQSTVSRHIAALEEAAGSPLLVRASALVPRMESSRSQSAGGSVPAKARGRRTGRGQFKAEQHRQGPNKQGLGPRSSYGALGLTQRGTAVLKAMGPMLKAALATSAALEASPQLTGEVTITTVAEMVRWLIVQHLPALMERHPQLRLRILADNRIASLAAGHADIAVRLVKPQRGDLIARRLWTEHYGFFASETLKLGPDVQWLRLAGALSHIADQQHAIEAFEARPARIAVEDLESLGELVRLGQGVAVLPRGFASRLAGVVEVRPEEVGARDLGPIPDREFWLIAHGSKHRLPKVRAVMDWLIELSPSKPGKAPGLVSIATS